MTNLRDRLDPELAAALDRLPSTPVFDLRDIGAARIATKAFAEAAAAATPDDPNVSVELLKVALVGRPDVPIRLFRPVGSIGTLPAVLWFHGGGQVVGYAAQEDPFLKRLASEVGCVVASVDYRLAPEAPAPAAAEDGLAAYRWLRSEAGDLGVDAERIAVAGASGGGCIAAATALMIRDGGEPAPRCLALSYPMLDDRNETRSSREITSLGIWDRSTNILAWEAVLTRMGRGGDISPYIAPARAERLSDLPTTFVGVGELDVFRDESLAFAARLVDASVPTELHLFPGAFHAFDLFAPEARVSRSFTRSWSDFLKRKLTD